MAKSNAARAGYDVIGAFKGAGSGTLTS